jgi:hypothetical protein
MMEKLKLAFQKVLMFLKERTLLVVCIVAALAVLIAMAVAANNARNNELTISPTPMVRLVSIETSSSDASVDAQDTSVQE